MAVNQTPGFNFDWKMIHGQMSLAGNRGQAEQAETSAPHQSQTFISLSLWFTYFTYFIQN